MNSTLTAQQVQDFTAFMAIFEAKVLAPAAERFGSREAALAAMVEYQRTR